MRPDTWGGLILVYLYGVVSAASLSKAIPLQDQISRLPGATAGSFAVFMSVMAVLPAIFGTLSGALIDRLGARPALIAACVLGAIANALYFFAHGIGQFQMIRVFEGVVPLFAYAAAPALMIAVSSPQRRSAAMALWSTYTPVGTSLGLLLAALYASDHWRDCYAVHGALFAVMALLGVLLPKPVAAGNAATAHAAGRRSPFALLLRRAGIAPLRLALAFGVLILLGLGVSIVFPPYLAQLHHMSIATASKILAGANMVMVLGGALSGIFLSRGMRVSSLYVVLAAVGSLAGISVFAPLTHLAATLCALVIWLLCTGAATAAVASLLPHVVTPEHRASAAGLLSQTGALLTFVTPVIWLSVLALNTWAALALLVVAGWGVSAVLLPAHAHARARGAAAPAQNL